MEKQTMYNKSIALKVAEVHVNPQKSATFKVLDGSRTTSNLVQFPPQLRSNLFPYHTKLRTNLFPSHTELRASTTKRRTKCEARGTLRIKLTQMDKYLRQIRKRRIYTHTILVTQECLDNRNQRPGSNTHETYTFPQIWESQATEYRHLVSHANKDDWNQPGKKVYM